MSLAHRTFASFRIPAYRRFFAGNVASLFGFWIRVVVQGWLVFVLTGSEVMLGAVTAVGLLPLALLSPLGGVLADRVDRRLLLVSLPVISVAANAALGVLVLSGRIAVVHLLLAAAVVGAARAVEIPVRNAFVRDLVGLEELPNAVALNAAGFNVARVGGPAVGAALLPLIGIGPCFLVAALMNALMIVAVAGMRAKPSTGQSPEGGPLVQLAEGFRYVRGHRRTRLLLALLAVTLLTTWAYQSLMPAYAKERLGLTEGGYALLMATIGAGALLGALWVAGWAASAGSRRNVVFGLLWGGATCVFLLGLVRHPALAVPLLLVAGFCQVGFIATANGMIQESVPDALRGRVLGLWTFTFGSCFPLGSLLMGAVSEALDVAVAWSGGAALMLVITGLLRWRLPPRGAPAASKTAR